MRRYQVQVGYHDRDQVYQIIMEAASAAELLEQLDAQPRLRVISIEELGEGVTPASQSNTDSETSWFKRYIPYRGLYFVGHVFRILSILFRIAAVTCLLLAFLSMFITQTPGYERYDDWPMALFINAIGFAFSSLVLALIGLATLAFRDLVTSVRKIERHLIRNE